MSTTQPILIADPTAQWETLYVKGLRVAEAHKIQALELLELAEKHNFIWSDLIVYEIESDTSEMLDGWKMPESVQDFLDHLNLQVLDSIIMPRVVVPKQVFKEFSVGEVYERRQDPDAIWLHRIKSVNPKDPINSIEYETLYVSKETITKGNGGTMSLSYAYGNLVKVDRLLWDGFHKTLIETANDLLGMLTNDT